MSAFDEKGDPAITLGLYYSDVRMILMHLSTIDALGASISRSHNEHLFGLFKCDLVIRMPHAVDACTEEKDEMRESELERGRGPDEILILNIEVDADNHRRENTKRFCRLRDEYLQSKRVVIVRLEVSVLDAMSDWCREKWITDVAATALLP